MEILIEWHEGKYPAFNVNLASKPGAEAFLEVKGCRIIDGMKGQFVSWPATKNEKSEKWWNHVWGSEAFNNVILTKALEARKTAPAKGYKDDTDNSIPF